MPGNNFLVKFKKIKTDQIAITLLVIYAFIFLALSFGRHMALKSYLNDLGNCDQIIWNSLHGHFFDNSVNMLGVRNYLGSHFSLILLVFVPFYAIIATPKWLLFFQVLAVSGSAYFIYLFAKEKLKNNLVAICFLIGYLLYPPLHNGLLYDFHEVVLAVFFAAGAFYFLEKGRDGWLIFFLTLLIISQEQLPLLVFMLGLYLAFFKRRYAFGFAVSLVSLIYFLLVVTVFIPHFSETGASALLVNESPYQSRYAWLGTSLTGIMQNIFRHPLGLLTLMFSGERLIYLTRLFIPVATLSLYSPVILLVAPLIALNLLSSNPMTFSLVYYHSAILAPFIYFAAINSFRRWFLDDVRLKVLFSSLMVLLPLALSYYYSVTPLSQNYFFSDYFPDKHAKKIEEIRKIIPKSASLTVQNNLGPHFSERRELYRFPLKIGEVDYILLDQTDPFIKNQKQIFGYEYALQMSFDEWKREVERLTSSSQYSLYYQNDGYLIFKKN
jgi:uncharacterized membrane protein